VFNIQVNDLIDVLEGFDEGKNAVVRGFSDLWPDVSKINNDFLEDLGLDIVLDIFGVEVDDFEDKSSGMQVDLFLR
jgi:hypothetical protein